VQGVVVLDVENEPLPRARVGDPDRESVLELAPDQRHFEAVVCPMCKLAEGRSCGDAVCHCCCLLCVGFARRAAPCGEHLQEEGERSKSSESHVRRSTQLLGEAVTLGSSDQVLLPLASDVEVN